MRLTVPKTPDRALTDGAGLQGYLINRLDYGTWRALKPNFLDMLPTNHSGEGRGSAGSPQFFVIMLRSWMPDQVRHDEQGRGFTQSLMTHLF